MKFLCLPGAYGSAKNFRIQLGPLADELERRGLATFTYTQGAHEVEPPAGWEDYFGTRPLYRFIDTRHGDNFEQLRRLRHMPYSINAEDAIRMCEERSQGEDWHQQVWRQAMNDVLRILDEHPDVDAVIGYSEGAMVGASLVVEEAEQAQRTGRQRRIKFAVFISGSPPLKFEGDNRVVAQLADRAGIVIDIPTFHIFGCNDAFKGGAVALYNVCEPSKSAMFDHGLGHIVPRDAENVQMLADILEQIIPEVEGRSQQRETGSDTNERMAIVRTPEASR
ncbi:serine hydrolase FSH [Corynascus novoguineensis]|uniref:Serine hydrolase FSH n=1 Tax=Corynascus novoguineensis TaxID=1126955 RepID=A0AAN7CSE4_9PEZI|nr:serine hydrolase FSH [Corynascus novoguineensis]